MPVVIHVPKTIDPTHELVVHYGNLVGQLLVNRGITAIEQARQFINPPWEGNHDPFLMKNLRKAVERIHRAIISNERITIYADYDADGIPGATALAHLFTKIGYQNFNVYLPHRHDEGYGIHIDALSQVQAEGTTLVISIDVGITAHDAAIWAHEHNLDLIITDHHEPLLDSDGSQNLPEPLYLVNPKQNGCTYPEPMLCGAGVIFKCIQGFLELYRDEYQIPHGWEKWLLDMIGLATLSDMVPLVGENRIFAYYGLTVMGKTQRPGLRLLMASAGVNPRAFTEEDITFSVTPQINAASRMSHPEDAYLTLKATTEAEATAGVAHLKSLNTKRKTLVALTMKEALAKLRNRPIEHAIVVGSPHWQAGILGLVASKLVEHYHLPAFVWSEEQGSIKGSCRSYDHINLMNIMGSVPIGTFTQYGGHQEAGGFSCTKDAVHYLPEQINNAVALIKENSKTEKEIPRHTVDAAITIDDVHETNYQQFRALAPFGIGNPKPLFLFENVTPIKVDSFGKDLQHTKLLFANSRKKTISAIKFFSKATDFSKTPLEGSVINMLAHIELSDFMGRRELRLYIVDIF